MRIQLKINTILEYRNTFKFLLKFLHFYKDSAYVLPPNFVVTYSDLHLKFYQPKYFFIVLLAHYKLINPQK